MKAQTTIAAMGITLWLATLTAYAQGVELNILGSWPGFPGGPAIDVALSQDVACVAVGEGGLQLIDISDPTSLVRLGGYNTSGTAQSVAISGSYAYVADGDHGLQIIDISNRFAPQLVGGIITGGRATEVVVQDGHAFVASHNAGLYVIDVSDPTDPRVLGNHDMTSNAEKNIYIHGLAVSRGLALLAQGADGLLLVDVSDPANPMPVGRYDTNPAAEPGMHVPHADAWDVAVSGNLAYLATSFGLLETPRNPMGLVVLDITEPSNPVQVALCTNHYELTSVAISGTHAYVTDYREGLQIIDIGDPSMPRHVSGLHTSADVAAWAIDMSTDYAYVAQGTRIQVVDIGNPVDPQEVSGLETGRGATTLAVSGNYSFVAETYPRRLQVIDVADPVSPVWHASLDTGGDVAGLDLDGSHAFVAVHEVPTAAGPGGTVLLVIDINDARNPLEIGRYEMPDRFARHVKVSGPVAVLALGYSGVQTVDISNPATPRLIDSLSTSGSANYVAISGLNAYVAEGDAGVVTTQVVFVG
jgi:hypothetical protein